MANSVKRLFTDRTWRLSAVAALVLSTLALFITFGTNATECAFAAAGTCPAGDTRTFARGLVINDDGADSDTQINGDTITGLFFADASTDRVGIGTTTPAALLHVAGAFKTDATATLAGISLTSPLGIASGGTGAATAAGAMSNLGGLLAANNLSDVANATTSRSNLGVTATGADTTYAFRSNNLSDLANATTSRSNLGLGSIATQAANSVSITGGSVTGIVDMTVTDGGTGTSSIAAYNVVVGGTTDTGPLRTVLGQGSSGQVLTSNGASALPSWQSAGSGGIPTDGWVDDTSETWTYANTDGQTGYFTVASDVSTKYHPGMRIKMSNTTTKYFIITDVTYTGTSTQITIYGGTDYTLANATISGNYHSPTKCPTGFPCNISKWTVETTDTTHRDQASPVSGTWYNLGNVSLTAPIGRWIVDYRVYLLSSNSATPQTILSAQTGLSTAATGVDPVRTLWNFYYWENSGATQKAQYTQSSLHALVNVTVKTTYYAVSRYEAGTVANLSNANADQTLVITFVSAYF